MRVLAIVLGGFLFLAAALAQSDRGTITGTIMDQAGAVVPDASVAISNTDTGIATTVTTTDTGNYTDTVLAGRALSGHGHQGGL